MAPQPLSSAVKSDRTFHIGPMAATERPDTAIWLAQAIANWSRVDAAMANLFTCLTGDKWEDAAELYGELESERSKDAAIKALALAAMSHAEHVQFARHFTALRTARKTRNKLAHWVWGVCDQVNDGLIAIDPRYLGKHVAKMFAGKARVTHIDPSNIYVFTSKYLKTQSAQFEERALASTMLTEMVHLKGTARDQRYAALSQFAHLRKV